MKVAFEALQDIPAKYQITVVHSNNVIQVYTYDELAKAMRVIDEMKEKEPKGVSTILLSQIMTVLDNN